MAFKLRSQNSIGTPLTWQEMDDNLSFLLTTMSGSFLTLIGNTSLRNNLSISGSLIISQSLTANNTSSLNDIIPNNNNTYNIGKPTSYWKKAYINNIEGTASYANNSISASYTVSSSYSNNSTSASYTVSSSYSNNSTSASYANNSATSSYTVSSSYSNNSTSASYAVSASWAPTNGSSDHPVTTILMANGMITYDALTNLTIPVTDCANLMVPSATPLVLDGSSRVKISHPIINNTIPIPNVIIPKFYAKIIGEFSCNDDPTLSDPDITGAGAWNDFKITGLHFYDNLGGGLAGLTYQNFKYNYYNKSTEACINLHYGWQIETEWMFIEQFSIDAINNGFLKLMYVSDLGNDVFIDRLTLLLQEF